VAEPIVIGWDEWRASRAAKRANLRRLGLEASSRRTTDYSTSGIRLRKAFGGLRVPRVSAEYSETGLPGYLQRDLDAFKEGARTRSSLMDCLWGELYGSINGAEIDDQAITHEHAEYLRDKYLRRKLP